MHKQNKSAAREKTPTGIPGFDPLTGGGLPSRRTTLLLGGPGAGKTVFVLQVLVAAAQRGERGIFVGFSESPRHLLQNAASFGWGVEQLEKEKLVFLDASARFGSEAARFDMSGMLAGVQAAVRETGATLVIFDSFDVVLNRLPDWASELQETLRLRDWLGANELTVLISANLEQSDSRAAHREALLQSTADCAVSLDFRVSNHTATRHLRVVKCRGSSCLENELAYRISPEGLEVLPPCSSEPMRPTNPGAALEAEIVQARKEMAERVQALDRFLEMKQAELDFLKEKMPAPARRPAGVRSRPVNKPPAGRLPPAGTQSSSPARQ